MAEKSDIKKSIQSAAETYCDAVYFARAEVFEDLCHERFHMTMIEEGQLTHWDKPAYLERVRGRAPFPGTAQYDILSIDETGGEMARVHLTVAVPPLTYEDHLGFVHVDGSWKLLTKVFRIAAHGDKE